MPTPSRQAAHSPSSHIYRLSFDHRALREHNNDVEAALAFLTSDTTTTTGNGKNSQRTRNGEDLAILQSLGVALDAAHEVLTRTGTLCDALHELGIEPPEGVDVGSTGNSSAKGPGADGIEGDSGSGASDGMDGMDGMDDDDMSVEEQEEEVTGPTVEEMKLFDDLAGDRSSDDEEGYLDVALEDEVDAADM